MGGRGGRGSGTGHDKGTEGGGGQARRKKDASGGLRRCWVSQRVLGRCCGGQAIRLALGNSATRRRPDARSPVCGPAAAHPRAQVKWAVQAGVPLLAVLAAPYAGQNPLAALRSGADVAPSSDGSMPWTPSELAAVAEARVVPVFKAGGGCKRRKWEHGARARVMWK